MENKTKVFRSDILKYYSPECLYELNKNVRNRKIPDNNIRAQEIEKILKFYNVPYDRLAPGTNRFGILVDGYAHKIALDRKGMIDNKREFKYSPLLYPRVIKVYETTLDGIVASSEYGTIFNRDDMYTHIDEMRDILTYISERYLIGDVGISNKNYANWIKRNDGSIGIMDFAYIYDISYKGFRCSIDDNTLIYDENFNYLICPQCHKHYDFELIRKRITTQDEENEIGDLSESSYLLSNEVDELTIDPNKSIFQEDDSDKDKKTGKNKHKPEYYDYQEEYKEMYDKITVEEQIKLANMEGM